MWTLFKSLSELLTALKANTSAVRQNMAAVVLLTVRAEQLLDRLRNLPDPEPISLFVTGERDSMLSFKIQLPSLPEGPNDIASGELTVTIDGGAPAVFPTAKDATEVDGFSGNDGAAVRASFAYIDDAGNKSTTPAVLDAVLSDTIPPSDPGALALLVTGETS
jgi:hypothetical protein